MEITWDQTVRLAKVLAKKISAVWGPWGVDANHYEVMAIPRGGLTVAALLTHELNIVNKLMITPIMWQSELEQYKKGPRVLVVDDIADTGQQIEHLRSWIHPDMRGDFLFATLIKRRSCSSEGTPDVYALEYPGSDWIDFPWEIRRDVDKRRTGIIRGEGPHVHVGSSEGPGGGAGEVRPDLPDGTQTPGDDVRGGSSEVRGGELDKGNPDPEATES